MTGRTRVLEPLTDAQGPTPPEVLFHEARRRRRRRRRRWIVGIAVVVSASAVGVPLGLNILPTRPGRGAGHKLKPVSAIQKAADIACENFARPRSATVLHAYPSTAYGVIVWRYDNTHGETTAAISLGMVGATQGSAPIAVCYMDHMKIPSFGPRAHSPAFDSKAVFTVNERNGHAGLVLATSRKRFTYPPPPFPTGKNVVVEPNMTLPPEG